MSVRVHRSELELWRAHRGAVHQGVWQLADASLGAAWRLRADPARLAELVGNFLFHDAFRGVYLQLIWKGATPAYVLATLKGFVPRRRARVDEVARGIVERGSRFLDADAEATRAAAEAFTGVVTGASRLFERLELGPRPVRQTGPFSSVREAALDAYDGDERLEGSAEGLKLEDGSVRPVVSLRLYDALELDQVAPFLEGPRVAGAVYQLSLVQERRRRRDGAERVGTLQAHAVADWPVLGELERAWAPDGVYVVREGALALPAAMWSLPFGVSPLLETKLAKRAVRLSVHAEGERTGDPPHASTEPARAA